MLRRIVNALVIFLLAALLVTVANAEELTATGEVRLENRDEPTTIFGLDLRAVEFSSDGESLRFSVELDRKIIPYLNENNAQAVAQFRFDTDNDVASGGQVFGSSESGFDYVTNVYACKARDDVRVCAGDIDAAKTYLGEFETEVWDAGETMFVPRHEVGWTGGDAVIDGSRIRGEVPYEDIGGSSGKTIRISVAAGSGRPVEMPSVRLTLN